MTEKLVSVIVPALNEDATLGEVIDRVLKVPLNLEILVVDDGSTDNTPAILKQFEGQIVVLTNPKPTGKGNAIRKALEVATGEVVVIQDADLEYQPEELPLVVQPILDRRADVVLGSRFMHGLPKGMALPNRMINRLLPIAVRMLFGLRITDEATCYKAIRTESARKMNLECQRFEFCPEVIAKACRLQRRILEVPISYVPRNKLAGKKIRWTDAPAAFLTLWRYRKWIASEDLATNGHAQQSPKPL